jgi:hypothetical protein
MWNLDLILIDCLMVKTGLKKQCTVTNTMYVMWDTCSLNTQDIDSNI